MDLAVMQLEAELRWLEMVEARLDDIRRQPVPGRTSAAGGAPRRTAGSGDHVARGPRSPFSRDPWLSALIRPSGLPWEVG